MLVVGTFIYVSFLFFLVTFPIVGVVVLLLLGGIIIISGCFSFAFFCRFLCLGLVWFFPHESLRPSLTAKQNGAIKLPYFRYEDVERKSTTDSEAPSINVQSEDQDKESDALLSAPSVFSFTGTSRPPPAWTTTDQQQP